MVNLGHRHGMAVFGGIHIDRIGHAAIAINSDTSTPGAIATRPGGVAANVARIVSSLGHATALCGAVGTDGDGDFLLETLIEEGLDTSNICRKGDFPTTGYLALHQPDGELAAALIDARTTESFSPTDVAWSAPAINQASLWFLDTNLQESFYGRIAQDADGRILAANSVSIAKAKRLRPILAQLDILFANKRESEALLDAPFENAGDAAAALVLAGTKAAMVSDGPNLLAIANICKDGEISVHDRMPYRAGAVDVTGVGDALIGASLHGLATGRPPREILELAAAAAAITLESHGSAPEKLTRKAINARIEENRP